MDSRRTDNNPAYSVKPLYNSSSEPAGDVIFRQLMQGVGEYLFGGSDFNEIPQMKIGSSLGHPRSLLHGMGDDGYGVAGGSNAGTQQN